MSEVGPTYSVELIDVLPLNREQPDGCLQQMPSRDDLQGIKNVRQGARVVAGYEVLLGHWRQAESEVKKMRTLIGGLK